MYFNWRAKTYLSLPEHPVRVFGVEVLTRSIGQNNINFIFIKNWYDILIQYNSK